MKNVLEYLEKSAMRNKNKIAVIEEEKKCSYEELLNTSKRIGSKLCTYVTTRKPVPVLMEKGINQRS